MRMVLGTPAAAADDQEGTGEEAAKVEVGKKVQREGGSCSSSLKTSEDSIDSSRSTEDDALNSAKAEMGEVREENQRLKLLLQQIEKDYKSLQLRFFDIFQHGPPKELPSTPSPEQTQEPADHHLVSLCLGRSSSPAAVPSNPQELRKKEKKAGVEDDEDQELKASLTLGLESKMFQLSSETVLLNQISPSNRAELEAKDDEAAGGETCPPSKMQKVANSGDDQEVAQQGQVKRARVSVRARCDAPTMNDGCQWRKYGQKIAKGNPCPRAYYRCTVAPACPVRKQVQRCSDDMSILITTYEGTHNHPLPVSATAMASTTSAAASMLLSGSSTSRTGFSPAATSGAGELNGINFSYYDNSRTRPFYLPSTSPSPLFPTITLDLTSSPSTSSTSYFNRFPSAASSFPRYPSTSSLSFSSADSSINLPTFWGTPTYNLGKVPQENVFQSFLEKSKLHGTVSQQSLTETLTKTIASDPSFRSVVAAAISSMVGKNGEHGGTESLVQNLVEKISLNALAQNGKGCGPSYFNGSAASSAGSQPAAGLLHSQPLFSIFNSASGTPNSNKQERKS